MTLKSEKWKIVPKIMVIDIRSQKFNILYYSESFSYIKI